MLGLGNATRGKYSQRHMVPPAQAQEEEPSSREVQPKERRVVAVGGRSGGLFWETELGENEDLNMLP